MATTATDQTSLDEREIEDEELEQILNDREIAKGKKAEATKKFKTLDDLAKDRLEELGIDPDEVVRIGRFRCAKSEVPSRAVSFETEPTTRMSIGVAKDE